MHFVLVQWIKFVSMAISTKACSLFFGLHTLLFFTSIIYSILHYIVLNQGIKDFVTHSDVYFSLLDCEMTSLLSISLNIPNPNFDLITVVA